jgi:hypothetical protein
MGLTISVLNYGKTTTFKGEKKMGKKEFLFDNVGVSKKVYKEILEHCLNMEYDTSGFEYDICDTFYKVNDVLNFMIRHEMIKATDLLNVDKEKVVEFIESLSFNETQSVYEFVNVDNVFYLLKV